MKSWIIGLCGVATAFLTLSGAFADDLLLEDYEDNGSFHVNRFDNSYRDSNGRKNFSGNAGTYATVNWAAKWSGLESTGKSIDLDEYKTFQVDIMVKPDQPVEAETNFYFQLLYKTDVGYAYWEYFVPQRKVPADGKWYRIQFPFKNFYANAGNGADKPADFATIVGTVCGMTFDETGDVYEYKTAHFDNIKVSRKLVEGVSTLR